MIKVITYGTFDMFHYGHYNLLKRARELGDYLMVGVSSDEMCISKGKIPILNEKKRIEIISNLKFVDKVIVESNMQQKVSDAIENRINIFVLGDDYKNVFNKMKEYDELIKNGVKVVFLERTPDVSTSDLKEKLRKQFDLDKDKNSLHNITNRK